jgi:hypothetical protein
MPFGTVASTPTTIALFESGCGLKPPFAFFTSPVSAGVAVPTACVVFAVLTNSFFVQKGYAV